MQLSKEWPWLVSGPESECRKLLLEFGAIEIVKTPNGNYLGKRMAL